MLDKPSSYELMDSGEGEKLERFGSFVLRRPSSIAIWKKRSPQLWKTAHSSFDAGRGWTNKLLEWNLEIHDITLTLRLQDNGQIGFFPEHSSYLHLIQRVLSNRPAAKVLNLFAYTGLASLLCAKAGAEVTHVDLSKKALGWFEQNVRVNSLPSERFRLVLDDAVKYLARSARKESRFDIVIVDPPSFSRTSKEKFWKLEEIVSTLAADAAALRPALLILTCHHPGISAQMLQNLLFDQFPGTGGIGCEELGIREANSPRSLSAGSLAWREEGVDER